MAKDKTHRGNTSQFYVVAELCRREFVAVLTMGNCPNTDVLCSNKEGTKFVHIQVKTFRPRDKSCSVGLKAEKNYGDNFFWVLCGIPEPGDKDQIFKYFIIPSTAMSRNVKKSFKLWKETPGSKGQVRSQNNKIRIAAIPPEKNLNGWDISPYLNNWQSIKDKLEGRSNFQGHEEFKETKRIGGVRG
ncbi:MAG: hypothetical protein KKB89_04040 [Candidatus Omnitrophica bacterium]|nr:hypothetical protein [Candidatus Omnitrophota bacterium]